MEVAVRYRLPITFIILNNNGIYAGEDRITDQQRDPLNLRILLSSLNFLFRLMPLVFYSNFSSKFRVESVVYRGL